VFRARVGDRELQGCDFLHIGEDGLIDEFTVMIRPLSAALAFAEAMKAEVPWCRPSRVWRGRDLVQPHTPVDRGSIVRLPNTAHTSRPWRIHELTRDFRLEDVWALPTPGGLDDFPRLVERFASGDPSQGPSRTARTLFAIRWKVGELLGWDDPDAGLHSRVPTLRDRLPVDLREAPSGPEFEALPFTSLYLLEDEWAAEIANRTMHGVMHIGLVPNGSGGYRGQMAVLVKPNGLLGNAYMAAIRPFRHLVVYPAMMRQIERDWRAGAGGSKPAHV
jgi:hypothetical protein